MPSPEPTGSTSNVTRRDGRHPAHKWVTSGTHPSYIHVHQSSEYELKKGSFCLLLLPTPDMVLSKAQSIQFWVKADHSTPLGFALMEKDGGRYNALFTVPKDGWQRVELSTSDFMLDQSKDAPKD